MPDCNDIKGWLKAVVKPRFLFKHRQFFVREFSQEESERDHTNINYVSLQTFITKL